SETSSIVLPQNWDFTAFAEAVHAHVLGQVFQPPALHITTTSTPSIPSHLRVTGKTPPVALSSRDKETKTHTPSPPPPSNHDSGDESLPDVATPAPEHAPSFAKVPPAEGGPRAAEDYAIVPPTQPGGILQLTTQDEDIRATVRQAIVDLDVWLSFHNSFPDALTRSREIANLLAQAAHSLGLPGLQTRLLTDSDFTRSLSGLVKQRMSTFRGNIKKLADSNVVAFFALTPVLITFYQQEEKKSVTWSGPNKGPIMRHLLHHAFCNGPTSIAAKNPDLFDSSMTQMPQAKEKEMPMAMVALVGAAVCSATALTLCLLMSPHHRFMPLSASGKPVCTN
ncbi:hypothetical protein BD311DRAFT_679317, partial [Dichomitus squalens]